MQKKRRLSAGGTTIRDVAARAEVSPMTVSRVINNEAYVSQALRERVEQAVRDLKFSPNAAARRLATVRGATIALLYDNPSRGFMGELLIGALDAANRESAQLVVRMHEESQPMEEVAEALALAGVEGVILVPPLCDAPAAIDAIGEAGLAVVGVAPSRADPSGPNVRIDNGHAAAEVAEHLLALGHRSFGFVGGREGQTGSEQRRLAFAKRLADEGIPPGQFASEIGDFTYESGRAAGERLLAREPRPTAIFAANDEMAAGVLAAALARGLAVPADLSIVGFDDTPIARVVTPPLTTVHQPVTEMATAAVELLSEEIRQRRAGGSTDTQVILKHSLVLRASTAPPPTGAKA